MLDSDELGSIFASLEGPKHKTQPKVQPDAKAPQYGRIAFVDMLFSWPPNGGADTDLLNVIRGLQEYGHQVHLFVVHEEKSTDRGRVDPKALPFPATRLDFAAGSLSNEAVATRLREVVDAWFPEIVVVSHGYWLKPAVLSALKHHKTISRYYAHELACLRDALRYREGGPCPNDFLRTPEECRRCSLKSLAPGIKRAQHNTWTTDYLAAGAYRPEHHGRVLQSLRETDAVIVSNAALKAHLNGFHENVFILPGGVDIGAIAQTALPERARGEKKIVLMVGRADDPLKGLDVLLEAGELLAGQRDDFLMWATHFDPTLNKEWFRALGWRDHAGALALYAKADVCVVPSIWEEPFGLTAVEAMASGRPVVASRVGGLQDIVRHGDTGYLFERGNARELAGWLSQLLDRSELRRRLGEAGRRVAVAEYDWKRIVENRYVPLLETFLE